MIKTKLNQLYELTLQLTSGTDEDDPERLSALVDLRDEVIGLLNQEEQLSDEQRYLLRQILEHDAVILKKMEKLRDEAATSLEKMTVNRLSKQKYEASFSGGSYFVDIRE